MWAKGWVHNYSASSFVVKSALGNDGNANYLVLLHLPSFFFPEIDPDFDVLAGL